MQLTIKNRLTLCWEILTIRSGHAHTTQEKQLPIFQRGYSAGMKDAQKNAQIEYQNIRKACAQRAEEVVWSLSTKETIENIKRAVLNA